MATVVFSVKTTTHSDSNIYMYNAYLDFDCEKIYILTKPCMTVYCERTHYEKIFNVPKHV